MDERIRILVVDDEPDLLCAAARVLDRARYTTATAASGAEALQRIVDFCPDLVLLDRDLPGMDGVEVCRRIKQDTQPGDVFVVFLSGTYTGTEQQAAALESGADGYIVRPLGNRELAARVAVYVRILKLTRTLRRERRALEARNRALRDSEERFRATFEQAAVGIAHVGLDDRLLRVNERFCDILATARPDLIGRQLGEFIHPEDRDAERAAERRLLAGEVPSQALEQRWLRSDDSAVWVNLTTSLLYEADGSPKHVIAVLEDITQRRQAEADRAGLEARLAQARRMELVARLAGGVAHEFNNMLNVILGHAELALEELPSEAQLADDLREVRDAAWRSADLVTRLLGFARKQPIAPRALDLNRAIEETVDALRSLVGPRITLSWQPAAELWAVTLDAAQLDQVLAQLCANGRDAIDDRGTLTLATANRTLDDSYCSAHPGSTPGDYVCLEVRDDGRGIEAGALEQLFEPFYSTKPFGPTAGLGLATVYGIVKQNRGYIEVTSRPGRGTAVEIYLPRHRDPEEPGAELGVAAGAGSA